MKKYFIIVSMIFFLFVSVSAKNNSENDFANLKSTVLKNSLLTIYLMAKITAINDRVDKLEKYIQYTTSKVNKNTLEAEENYAIYSKASDKFEISLKYFTKVNTIYADDTKTDLEKLELITKIQE